MRKCWTFVPVCAMCTMHESTKNTDTRNSRRRKDSYCLAIARNYRANFCNTQAEQIQLLKDEIARLKGQKPQPKIRPSKLEKGRKKKEKSSSGKGHGSQKREKTADLVIHEHIHVPPESIPEGSIFKGVQPYTVQGIKIQPYNICYLLERWQTPDGKNIVGKLPSHVQGHYDFELKSYILYQYFHCHVIQPLLLEQLWEWGVGISAGQLNRILTEDKDIFSFWDYLIDRLSNANKIPPLQELIVQYANAP